MRSCGVCGGKLKDTTTNIPVELSGKLLYVKGVPAMVCRQCGEVFLSDPVAIVLEKLTQQARERQVELEVLSYTPV